MTLFFDEDAKTGSLSLLTFLSSPRSQNAGDETPLQQSTPICLYPFTSTLTCQYTSWVLVTGSERACKTVFYDPRSQHNLKIAAESSSGTLFCSALTMEHLFLPCTRLHDIMESQGRLEEFRAYHPEGLQELNLNVSTEELLSAERLFTYADVYATIGNEDAVAWLTPHTAILRSGVRLESS
jgi:hypothetical protein